MKAAAVVYNPAAVTMDISAAYPAAAGIKKWRRKVQLNKGKNVIVEDVIQLKKAAPVVEHLMTCYPADVVKPGVLAIHQPSGDIYLLYYAEQFTLGVEKVPLPAMEDEGVKQKWGDNIYRINLNAVKSVEKGRFVFRVANK